MILDCNGEYSLPVFTRIPVLDVSQVVAHIARAEVAVRVVQLLLHGVEGILCGLELTPVSRRGGGASRTLGEGCGDRGLGGGRLTLCARGHVVAGVVRGQLSERLVVGLLVEARLDHMFLHDRSTKKRSSALVRTRPWQ